MTAAAQVEFEGEALALGRTTYVVPALPLRHVQGLLALAQEMDAAAAATDAAGKMAAMGLLHTPIARLLHLSLARNYPDLPADFVDRALDLATFQAALPLLLSVNGLAKGTDAGAEGKGGASRSRSTGARSTRG